MKLNRKEKEYATLAAFGGTAIDLTPEQEEERKLRDKKRELTPKQRRSRKRSKAAKQARKING